MHIRTNWRAWLIYLHRWLGIAGCVLFLAWFVSGIVMMYARMPAVTADERLTRAEPLDLSTVRVSPAEAAAAAGVKTPGAVQVSMLGGRPVYRFGGASPKTVFADNADLFAGTTAIDALALAGRWAPEHARTLCYDTLLTVSDQWTLQTRQHLPLHVIALGDAADSRVYVSGRTGEVVMDTTRGERFWAYWGPVTHWLYLPLLRRNGPLWTQVIIWSSGIGCVMCVAGLAIGLLRYSPSARFRLRRESSRTPYAGMMKWHHYAGLIFGVVTFTWTFSGLLSMGPWDWQSNGGLTREQRRALSGAAPASLDAIDVPRLRAAASAIGRTFAPKEMMLTMFRGEPFWQSDAASPRAHRVVAARHPERGAFARFDDDAMTAVARDAMPGAPVVDAVWLQAYDDYYYDRRGERPLPVLRVRYADAQRTWLYLDPQRGAIALTSRPGGRLNRWLYHGLHSLDFPFLYYYRPLWDIVVIVLSLGGIALGVTTLMPAWRRLRRHAGRVSRPRDAH